MPVQPFYREEYQPLGGGMSDGHIERAKVDAAQVTEEQQAAAFQQHLRTGLQGMQQVLSQLPPEVAQKVGDPAPFADSDEKRVLWYQGVNQAINQMNMGQAALRGDQAGVDALMPNDPKFGPADATAMADRSLVRQGMQASPFTKTVERPVAGASAYSPSGNSMELGNDDQKYVTQAEATKKNLTAYMPLIEKYAKEYGIPVELALALAATESGGTQNATSQTGVRGIFQLTEGTAREMGVDREDIKGNIKGGIGYLKKKLDAHEGDMARAFAAYNGGDSAVQKAYAKHKDKWQDFLQDYLEPVKYEGGVISPAKKAEEMRGHVMRGQKYNAYYGGAQGLAKTEAPGKTETTTERMNSGEIAEMFLKKGVTPETAKKVADMLGSASDGDYKMIMARLKERQLDDLMGRHNENLGLRKEKLTQQTKEHADKKIASYVKATKSLPEISHNLQELDSLVDIDGDAPIPGVGWGNKPFKAWFLSTNPESEAVRNAVASIFTRLGHEISGANFTEQEMKHMEDLMGIDMFHSETYFRYAMRRLRSETEMKLRHFGAGLGDAKDEAEGRGAVTDTKPPVPDTKPKAADAVSAAKAKYKLEY